MPPLKTTLKKAIKQAVTRAGKEALAHGELKVNRQGRRKKSRERSSQGNGPRGTGPLTDVREGHIANRPILANIFFVVFVGVLAVPGSRFSTECGAEP